MKHIAEVQAEVFRDPLGFMGEVAGLETLELEEVVRLFDEHMIRISYSKAIFDQTLQAAADPQDVVDNAMRECTAAVLGELSQVVSITGSLRTEVDDS